MAQVVPSPVETRLDDTAVPRIGLIALATDLTSERDAATLLPRSVALHVTRIPFDNPTTPDTLKALSGHLAGAADRLVPGAALSAVIFSCTAASVTIGDAAVAEAIASARPGVPVVTPPDAACAALATLGVSRIALLTPYLPQTTAPMVDYFEGRGIAVAAAHCLGLADDRDMARVTADTIIAAGVAADVADAQALFVSCTALPALGVVAALEARLRKPVVTSNQASLWRALRHAGSAPSTGAPGRLFQSTAAVSA